MILTTSSSNRVLVKFLPVFITLLKITSSDYLIRHLYHYIYVTPGCIGELELITFMSGTKPHITNDKLHSFTGRRTVQTKLNYLLVIYDNRWKATGPTACFSLCFFSNFKFSLFTPRLYSMYFHNQKWLVRRLKMYGLR